MKIEALENVASKFIESKLHLEIPLNIFSELKGRNKYNSIIRKYVTPTKYGVYIWVNKDKEEVVYIGMAGKIKNNGKISDHPIAKRLTAPRCQNKLTGKWIQTNDFINNFMLKYKINILQIRILYIKDNIPPSYLESLLLYKYYLKNKKLPELNSEF